MLVKFKKVCPEAVTPSYAREGDACFDLTAVKVEAFNEEIFIYSTGLAIEIPEGYVGLIFPRSSVYRKNLLLHNSVGVIDAGYRGEIKAIFRRMEREHENELPYKAGERFAQMLIIARPNVQFEEVEELSETERGEGGFGSTGQ